VKAFTERNPRIIGAIAVVVVLVLVAGVLLLNRSVFTSSYTVHARFPSAAGIGKGAPVLVAGVQVGSVGAIHVDGNSVVADLALNNGVVLPQKTAAAIEVETVLGVLDVTLEPRSGWDHPLTNGAMITDTTIPVEFQDLENTAGNLLQKSDVAAFNQLLESLQGVTQDKQAEVAAIISGLDRFTGAIDQRQSQVSSLIDSADQVAATVAQRDQQLGSLVDSLAEVVQGLASHSSELSALIENTEAVAAQTASLVGDNQPQLQGLISNLGSVLGVIQQHQDDLAEAVSYIDAAVTGFQSIATAGPADTPVPWANQYANLIGLAQGYNVLGSCGALDQALDEILGPDPTPCDERTGPPVTSNSATPSGPAASSGSASTASGTSSQTSAGAASGSAPAAAPANALQQLLDPLLGGKP
jgi:phospholipid/cholesterol/gamma-HCH transport system substrate-binding protein